MKIDVCQSGLFTRNESVNRFVYLAASVGLKVDSKLSRNGLKYHFFKVLDFCLTVNLNQNFLYLFNFLCLQESYKFYVHPGIHCIVVF